MTAPTRMVPTTTSAFAHPDGSRQTWRKFLSFGQEEVLTGLLLGVDIACTY